VRTGETAALPPVVGAAALQERLVAGEDVRLLDVRTPAEFETAHIAGAYNVPLDTLGEHREDIRRRVDRPVVLVCRSGSRAKQAESVLRASGMENLHLLEGGMAAWEAAGLPLVRGVQKWSLERQVRLAAGSLVVLGVVMGWLVWSPLVVLAGLVGAGLTFSAVTNTCGLAWVLGKLPYNRSASCDVRAMVGALTRGPAGSGFVAGGRPGAAPLGECCG
jgi:rhodanese-related sulfurtransferase